MQTNGFVKGLMTGAVVGIALSTAINPPDRGDVKKMSRNANRAWTTVGSMIDGVVGNMH